MPKVNSIQLSFNAGEFSPEVASRSDLSSYPHGCTRLENMYPLVQGAARRRPGFRYVKDGYLVGVGDSSKAWFARFEFSTTQAYILEFTNNLVAFYTDHGPLLNTSKVITGITKGSSCVVTSVAHGFSTGDRIYIDDVVGMTEVNGRQFIVQALTADTFELRLGDVNNSAYAISSAAYTTYTSGGTVAKLVTVATPWTSALLNIDTDFFALDIVQSGDVLYVTNKNGSVSPYKIARVSNTSWTCSALIIEGGVFEDVDPDETVTIYTSARSGSVTLTASSAAFVSGDVGRYIYLEQKDISAIGMWQAGISVSINAIYSSDGKNYKALNSGTTGSVKPTHARGSKYDGQTSTGVQWEFRDPGYGYANITAYSSSTSVTATVIDPLPDGATLVGNASTRWALGDWSSSNGYPTHVDFFRERLVFARSSDNKIWLSVAGSYEDFHDRDDGGEVTSDMGISIQLQSSNKIQWLASVSTLIVGTASEEWSVQEMTTNEVLSPSNVTAIKMSDYGSKPVEPEVLGNSVIFVQRDGRTLREIYTDVNGTFQTIDVSALATHLFPKSTTIKQLAHQLTPHRIIWVLRDDGKLFGFTREKEHEVFAWHRHLIGGSGVINSIAVIPNPSADADELWALITHTISSTSWRYAEYMDAEWVEDDGIENAVFMDCAATYDGSAATVIGGLFHLNGEPVTVLADGVNITGHTPSGGKITLSKAASVVQVGLHKSAKLATLRFNEGAARGTAQTRIKRISKAFIRFLSTVGGKVGSSETDLETLPFRFVGDDMDDQAVLYSDDYEIEWPGDYDRQAITWYVQDLPLPVTVVAIVLEADTQG